jgi:hypothetical protein
LHPFGVGHERLAHPPVGKRLRCPAGFGPRRYQRRPPR